MSRKYIRFNAIPNRVAYDETIEGLYSITTTKALLQVTDIKSDFNIRLSTNRHVKWKTYQRDNNQDAGDTLVVRFMPTKGSGMIYEFYN